MKIQNQEITEHMLEIMHQFIEYYEDIKKIYEEYNGICEQIKKRYNIPETDSLIEILENRINKNLIKRISTGDNEQLECEYNELKKLYDQIYIYRNIINLKKEFDQKKLGMYFKQENLKKIEITGIKEQLENKKNLSIEEVYINIKNIYELYSMIYEYEKLPIIAKIKLKRLISKNQNNNDIPIIIGAIENFNEIEGPKIEEAIKKAKKEPNEIVIDQQITIITTPQKQYVKTKSA